MAEWTEVVFENREGKVTTKYDQSEEFKISEFERKILDLEQNLKARKINKSDRGDGKVHKQISSLHFACVSEQKFYFFENLICDHKKHGSCRK